MTVNANKVDLQVQWGYQPVRSGDECAAINRANFMRLLELLPASKLDDEVVSLLRTAKCAAETAFVLADPENAPDEMEWHHPKMFMASLGLGSTWDAVSLISAFLLHHMTIVRRLLDTFHSIGSDRRIAMLDPMRRALSALVGASHQIARRAPKSFM